MIRIPFGVFFLGALLVLILPLDWFGAIVIAAVFHELCHILMVLALDGSISEIRFKTTGCEIKTNTMGEWAQFFSILAGPLGSFSLLALCRTAPKLAICGLIQGLSNLIPVLPLDGGRLLLLLLYRFCPDKAEKVMNFVTMGICLLFGLLAIYLSTAASAGLWPVFLAVFWSVSVLSRKIPCKPSRIRVQ